MARREFSREQKAEMSRRAMRNGVLRCEGCGADLTGKRIEFDHVLAEALIRPVHPDRPLTAEDGQVLGECCHRGPDGKTARDVEDIAKAKRREAGHFGFRRKGRGFPKPPPQHTASRPIIRKSERMGIEP